MNPNEIKISDYTYHLPPERIAQFPLKKRDEAKLQVYRQGGITHSQFKHLGAYLAPGAMLVFNNTRVIRARILFFRETGAKIEVFVLEPADETPIHLELAAEGTSTWKCIIGNQRKWKPGEVLKIEVPDLGVEVRAELIDREKQWVKFSWDREGKPTDLRFATLLEEMGKVPLPPYISREAKEDDSEQYQTIYAAENGAVAAPTAGLHFTPEVFADLEKRGIEKEYVTLHVGAGTFLPVKEDKAVDHPMHSEEVSFSRATISRLKAKLGNIVVVGTTVTRVLESLYWLGCMLHDGDSADLKENSFQFFIPKLMPYDETVTRLSPRESLEAIEQFMEAHELDTMMGKTEILIVPGYEFKMCNALITNYHMPDSTLILLIAAFIGEDWRKVYQEALDNDYRFFSYGDSSLLIP